jgi:hypothetical protein
MTAPSLTLFSAPKPFNNPHIDIIQRNSIRSWMQLGTGVQVVLVGEEAGLVEVAEEYRLRLLTQVIRNEQGTPLVSSIFSQARRVNPESLLAYVNADIILFPDFYHVAQLVSQQLGQFLIVGQRWDLRIDELLDFSKGWEARLKSEVQLCGGLHAPSGSDYFIFPQSIFNQVPDFAIGRAGWDNWMIYRARKQGWLVVDATPSLMVVHQDHDYSHLPGGKPHYDLMESDRNMILAGGINRMYTVLDSDRQFFNGLVSRPRFNLLRLARRIETWLMSGDQVRSGPRWAIARKLRRWRRKKTGSLV